MTQRSDPANQRPQPEASGEEENIVNSRQRSAANSRRNEKNMCEDQKKRRMCTFVPGGGAENVTITTWSSSRGIREQEQAASQVEIDANLAERLQHPRIEHHNRITLMRRSSRNLQRKPWRTKLRLRRRGTLMKSKLQSQ